MFAITKSLIKVGIHAPSTFFPGVNSKGWGVVNVEPSITVWLGTLKGIVSFSLYRVSACAW